MLKSVEFKKSILKSIIVVIAGSSSVLGFAPFGIYLLPYLALSTLFWIWHNSTPKAALFYGWLFGLGLMVPGVLWLRISISQFGGVNSVMATVATLGFISFVASYFAIAGWLGCKLTQHSNLRLTLSFPAAWCIAEWLRGWIFTGFPWLSLGYSQIDSSLAGYAPLLGVYGISLMLALSAGFTLLSITQWFHNFKLAILGLSLTILIWLCGLGLTQWTWTNPHGPPFPVSLIQPSIPQSLKWDPQLRTPTLQTYSRLTRQASGNLIIWPETAVPDFLHRVETEWLNPLIQELKQRNSQLLVGSPVLDVNGVKYYNAAVLLGPERADYYKRHLVPFGEYLPLKIWLSPMLTFLKIPMSNFAAGQHTTHSIKIAGQNVGVSICYEDAFGEEIRQALPDATYLINLSNDAWFGDSLAPHQHLEISRMRALETGRFLIRATNSGISAIIGPNGKIQTSTQLFTQTVLTDFVQPLTAATPFVLWGDNATLGLVAMLMITLILITRANKLKPNPLNPE